MTKEIKSRVVHTEAKKPPQTGKKLTAQNNKKLKQSSGSKCC